MQNFRIKNLRPHIKAIFVLTLVLLFPFHQLQAQKLKQEYTYKHYTIHDGLAQMQVMSLYQDSKGYLWCATKAGLSRFDGKHFKNFTEGISLPSFDITTMGESKAGNLLFFGALNFAQLCKDTIIQHTYPESTRSSSYLPHSTQNKLKEVTPLTNGGHSFIDYSIPDSLRTYKIDDSRGEIILIDENNSNHIWQSRLDSIFVSKLKTQTLVNSFANPKKIERLFEWGNRYVGINSNNEVYEWSQNEFRLLVRLDAAPFSIKIIQTPQKDALIISTDKDLFHFKNKLTPIKKNLTRIRDILFDNEENLWVATEEGLYNFFQLNFVNYSFGMGNKDWVWSVLEDSYNNFWFASYQNGLWKWDGKNVIDFTQKLNSKLNSHLKTRTAPEQYRYYMGASKQGTSLYFPTECNVLKYVNNQFSPVKNILELPYQITKAMPDESMIFAGYAGLFQQNKNGETKSWSRDSVGVSSILNVEFDDKERIVAIGKDGVAVVSNDTIIRFQKPFNQHSYSSTKDHRNNIWIGGTKNVSLYNNDSIILVSQKKEEAFYSLLFVEPHYLFLGGIKGLYVANLDNYYKNGTFETLLFNQSCGFTGIECGQNGFLTDSEGMVWIPTSDLVTRFDPKKLIEKEIKPPATYLNCEVSIDNIHWINCNIKHKEKLDHNSNNLRFKLDIVSFSNAGNTRFYYKLEGLQKNWLEASGINEITFYDLKPGRYKLLAKADAGIRSAMSETQEIEFEIKSPFWIKWWFVLCEIIGLTFLIYFLIQYFRKREQQKALTKHRLTQLRSEALAAQLDPHFVMNCLNNISGLVNAGYKKQANEYIVKFSLLLRVILQSVKKEAISLNDELDMVSKYMALEQFRCNNCFTYEIISPKNYSAEKVMVPPMMLQPLVENSIKHGFGNSKVKDAQIEITIKAAGKYLYFSITDNGKGLQSKAELTGTGLGTKIIRERIELLQKKNDIEFTIKDNNPGVDVSFKIPLVLSKN